MCHSFTHYLLVVAQQDTQFVAAWMLVNAHGVAVLSGITAAVDLGAGCPADMRYDIFALLSSRLNFFFTGVREILKTLRALVLVFFALRYRKSSRRQL